MDELPTKGSSADVAQAVDRLVDGFETLSPSTVDGVASIYAAGARFKDPFNDVYGIAAIAAIFSHMFESLREPRFKVTGRVLQGEQCFLTWEFRFYFRNFRQHQEQLIVGASHLIFDTQGTVRVHRDYWDAAEELYEKLPLVGGLMRWLKRRANS
jgi:hypothetical protein